MSESHNILQTTHSKVHTIPSSQVQYIKTSPRAAHDNWEGWDVSMCDPGDALAGDDPTCEPATIRHGSTTPPSAAEKREEIARE
jgi:hypothetical protein